jgi:hypothetical protein
MSGIKPIYQWQHCRGGALKNSWWQDCTEADFNARDNKPQFNVRIMFETTAAIETLRSEAAAQAKRIEELEAATKHLGLTPQQAKDGLARHKAMREVMEAQRIAIKTQQEEIEALRKQVEALGHKAPTSFGFCKKQGGCLCGGDVPRVQHGCSNWVKSAQKGTE